MVSTNKKREEMVPDRTSSLGGGGYTNDRENLNFNSKELGINPASAMRGDLPHRTNHKNALSSNDGACRRVSLYNYTIYIIAVKPIFYLPNFVLIR